MSERNIARGLGSTVWFIAASLAVGVTLAAVTKGVFWALNAVVSLIWEWLPDQLGVDATTLPYLAVLLATGGLLVGLGNRYLGYHPEPLETVMGNVKSGGVIEHKTIPQTLLNSVASLGFGGPLGPEAALVATVGGLYFWVKASIEEKARDAYRSLFGPGEGTAFRIWSGLSAATVVVGLVAAFRLIPGGISTSFVPVSSLGFAATVGLGFVTGVVGGIFGILTSRTEGFSRSRGLFKTHPLATGVAGGLFVAVAASKSYLVLFSGSEQMTAIFAGTAASGELLYSAGAKWIALMVVFAMGWKGGPIFPLMYISGATAVAIAQLSGADPVVMYAAGIAAAVAGALNSAILGVAVALLVVPTSLLVPIIVGALSASVVLRLAARGES